MNKKVNKRSICVELTTKLKDRTEEYNKFIEDNKQFEKIKELVKIQAELDEKNIAYTAEINAVYDNPQLELNMEDTYWEVTTNQLGFNMEDTHWEETTTQYMTCKMPNILNDIVFWITSLSIIIFLMYVINKYN